MSAATPPVVLVTGASGGLGRAFVQAFRNGGWNVAAASHQKTIHETADHLLSLLVEVTERDSVRAAVEATLARWGRIDALINNAGITGDELMLKQTEAGWQRVLDVNLKGAFLFTQAVTRPMLRQENGHIINVSSYVARVGRAGQTAYAAAKAGLISLTETTAKELGTRNVRANAILPGLLATPMTEALASDHLTLLAGENALGRINTVEEVAAFTEFLVRTRNISGQVFQLDSRIARWC